MRSDSLAMHASCAKEYAGRRPRRASEARSLSSDVAYSRQTRCIPTGGSAESGFASMRRHANLLFAAPETAGETQMLIRIGFDIELAVATPMALIYLLRVHPSRRDDLLAPENLQISSG